MPRFGGGCVWGSPQGSLGSRSPQAEDQWLASTGLRGHWRTAMVALDLWVWGIALVAQMIAETVEMSTHPPSINGERFIHYANSKIYKEASYANIDMRKDDKHHVTDKRVQPRPNGTEQAWTV